MNQEKHKNKRIRVLLADDDADDRALFESAYQDRQDILLLPCVVNGVEVVEYLKVIPNEEDLPDLIVLDQNMPLMTGKETLKFLKSSKRYARIPVCICSTYADFQLVVECGKLGAHKVTSKPISAADYQDMMDGFLTAFKVETF